MKLFSMKLSGLLLLCIMLPFSTLAKAIIDASQYETLQKAFDAVPQDGGIVTIPPKDYPIDKPLVISTPDTRIAGTGAATHIINKNKDNQPALILRHKDYPQNNQARLWRVQVANLRISGSTQSGHGLIAQGINEIELNNVAIDHNGGDGIHLVDCYEDPRVVNCILTYNAQSGLHILRGHDIVVNANQFEENLDALQCIDSFNLCMNGNNLDDHLRHGVVIENTYGSVLSGNMIEECQGYAVVMDRDCYGNTVSANVIAHDFSGGILLKDAWGCSISANTFTMCKPYGIEIQSDSGKITIGSNNFSNAYIGGENKRDDHAGGILLKETNHIVITGNSFTGLSTSAIYAEGVCEKLVISGNLIADPFEPAKSLPAIAIPGMNSLDQTNIIDWE